MVTLIMKNWNKKLDLSAVEIFVGSFIYNSSNVSNNCSGTVAIDMAIYSLRQFLLEPQPVFQ